MGGKVRVGSMEKIVKERTRLRMRVIKKLREYSRELGEKSGRISLILFGSFVRGDFNLWSDIDVIIISERFRGVRFIERCLNMGGPLQQPHPDMLDPGGV